MGRIAEARLALMALTRLPAGRFRGPPPPLGAALWAMPLAGLTVGALGAAPLFLPALLPGLSPAIAAGLSLAAMALATGALHEDGLADLADGFGGGRTVARKLEIMRDSRIGSYGVVALGIALWLRGAALADLGPQGALALLPAAAAGRAMVPLALRALPPARPDGLGRAAAQARAGRGQIAAALGIALAAALPFGVAGLAGLLGAALGAALVGGLARRQIGGQTGDVLGTIVLVSETIALLVHSVIA